MPNRRDFFKNVAGATAGVIIADLVHQHLDEGEIR